jgi:hypothetical protein
MNASILRYFGALAIVVATSPRSVDAAAPAGHYVVEAGNGTVFDTKSGLTWQQPVFSKKYSWAEAKTRCSDFGPGWRLPTIKELLSIVDSSEILPAIDPNAFPSTPSESFWSSSPFAGSSSSAWYVDFGLGHASFRGISDTYSVRCVR